MKKRLTWRELGFIGTMLFGLFFGAGNLIFPIFLGQQAGSHVWAAIGGLLISGIGLPLLGVTGMGLTRSTGVFDLASKVNRPFAYAFTVLLYLTLGPFSALPRLATTSFQIGLAPFVAPHLQTGVLAGFSVAFFLIAWLLARHPGKLMTYIGKWLTPFFLILLAIIMGAALLHPLGGLDAVSRGGYVAHPVLSGFTEGYNTLDALAALAFGVIVIDSIRDLGVTDSRDIARYTIKTGAISMSLMAVIYTLLALIGTMSLGHFSTAANGGVTLAQIADYYFGVWGTLLLAVLVIIACLKTAIGLISAFGDTLSVLFPKFSYPVVTAFAAILPCLFANAGLTRLIAYSTPILLFLYPLAIVLIVLAVLSPLLGMSRWLFGTAILLTLLPAFGSAASGLPTSWQQTGFFQAVLHANAWLPFAAGGFSWLVPALVGIVAGWLLGKWRDPQPQV
ncbi:branched-chain amino acid transport system II carrier protein [Levilactobacillus namurensis]|uniref:branched-chain amino acid transport system II carrier protein n=1 Tax=Levilactobacillus namurensis TaxID=380393 RepID=UPI002230D671|nr:branched-chain amino acid transport system II carrier protein [Levilactobacillus namurensis]MCW3779104.1 branched-chain amino acid transport system II carrier protein [Levilactobacillus namurensis]MDT7019912.1 branched-chain amino acid transport system II carrier protein [Levilactobacillus namurensis]WNN65507.1 branched-chain amino acid transport system II carrier protein [Levilactobacillus namurensis]